MPKAKTNKAVATNGDSHHRMLILGSGPAGLSAAMYAARAELAPLLLTGMELHGQASLTFQIENYPGFPEGIGGPQLGELFQKQAERFGARILYETAEQVDLSKRPFKVRTYDKEYRADSLIITTGAVSNHLNVPGEAELTGRGVSYCANCDGWFFKDKRVMVVGGGDSALEEAIFLTRYASSITIIHRRKKFRASPILQARADKLAKISFIMNHIITGILGEDAVKAVRVKDVSSQKEKEIQTDGVFVFIGQSPNSKLFEGQLEMDDHHYIRVNHLMETNVPGVYAAGEVADPIFRQVVTSAGMGAAAAIQAARFLERK